MIQNATRAIVFEQNISEQDIDYIFNAFNQQYAFYQFRQNFSILGKMNKVLFVPIDQYNIFISDIVIAEYFKQFLDKNKNRETNPKIHTLYCDQIL